MVYENTTLCVPRGGGKGLERPVIASSQITSVPNGHVVIKVDKFGWSANNVTYGILGEDAHFRYFDFHPAPETSTTSAKTHGVIPVWSFGSVVESKVSAIQKGERVFGYFAPAKYVLLQIDERDTNKFSFYVNRPHLPADRRPYNQITRCGSDPLYTQPTEDTTMLYRPLFWTSFWCEDWINSMNYRNVKRVVISSASSKTGFCLALAIRKRIEKTGKNLRIIGLTSPSNLNFVKSLGFYDEVLLYDNLTQLDLKAGPYCYVDVAGNDKLNDRVVAHLGDSMTFGVSLGMSHVSETTSSIKETAEKTAKFEVFFMPEWMAEVRKRIHVTEIAKMQKEGWGWLTSEGAKVVKIERSIGTRAIMPKYMGSLKGSLGPDKGLVFSFWGDEAKL